MSKFIDRFSQSWVNGRKLGDSRWFTIKMAVRGKFLTDDAYKEFIDRLLRIECCDECKESVKTMKGEQQ
jgi:hypothetical protein